jgi:hypothetical protein
MAIQSFSVGQVLTAAQVNALQANDYNQTVSNKIASYILVAADKGTRITMSSTSATTITVNTDLFSAGDTLFIQNLNTGVSTITAGTATVTTSASLALAQWEGGTLYFTSPSAAIFIKGAGAAASSVPANASGTNSAFNATNSSSYTDMSAPTGPAVTVTTGTKALVIISARIRCDQSTGFGWMSYAVSGATTVSASDTTALMKNGTNWMRASAASVVTLTAGSNTFTTKYKSTTAGYVEVYDRDIFVMNLA